MRIIFLALVICFTGMAQAKTFNEKVADSMDCASEWLQEARGVPKAYSYNINYMTTNTVGGPELPLFISAMSNCLGRKHDKIGSTQQIANLPEGDTVLNLVNDFTSLIK